MKIDYELASPVLAFGFGALIGYLFAPDDWYQDRVQACLDMEKVAPQVCFNRVAEWAYEEYLAQ